MHHEGEDDEFAVADLVADESADDDAEAKADESCAADRAKLCAGEAELGPQLSKMPPRMAKPTPAARMAMNPAQRSRLAFGAIPSVFAVMWI